MGPELNGYGVVLVDERPLWLEILGQLTRTLGLQVLGAFVSSSTALAGLDDLHPDLLIASNEMPVDELDGIELVREAQGRLPDLKTIVLSDTNAAEVVDAAFAAGADVVVLKTAHADDLTSAIRQPFLPTIYLAGSRTRVPHPEPARGIHDSPKLTRRELEILDLMSEGHSNAELARMLWVAEQTVKFHLSNIYRKLGVSNRTEASHWAQLHGLLSRPEMPLSIDRKENVAANHEDDVASEIPPIWLVESSRTSS